MPFDGVIRLTSVAVKKKEVKGGGERERAKEREREREKEDVASGRGKETERHINDVPDAQNYPGRPKWARRNSLLFSLIEKDENGSGRRRRRRTTLTVTLQRQPLSLVTFSLARSLAIAQLR